MPIELILILNSKTTALVSKMLNKVSSLIPTTKKHILDSHSAKKSYKTISKPTTPIKSHFNSQEIRTKIPMINLSIAKNKTINISKEEESKCFMIKLKEDQKSKNHTLIGDKFPLKSSILDQDFKKRNKSLHNGSSNLWNITKTKKVFTKDILFNLLKSVNKSSKNINLLLTIKFKIKNK